MKWKQENVTLEENYPPARTCKYTCAVAALMVGPLLEPIIFQSITGIERRIKNKLNLLNTEVKDSYTNTMIYTDKVIAQKVNLSISLKEHWRYTQRLA